MNLLAVGITGFVDEALATELAADLVLVGEVLAVSCIRLTLRGDMLVSFTTRLGGSKPFHSIAPTLNIFNS